MEEAHDPTGQYSSMPYIRSRRTHVRGIVAVMSSVDLIARRLLDIREVATYTGLSPHTLYTMVSQRRIPFVKLGGALKFDKVKVDDWIEKHAVLPMSPRVG
jgi:excisionase family DNA binding protein